MMRARPRPFRAAVAAGALAVALFPATALANPGPDPAAELAFFVIGIAEIALAGMIIGSGMRALGSLALGFSVLGLSSIISWESSVLFQVPAALLLVLALFLSGHGQLKRLSLVVLVVSAIALAWTIDRARHPQFRLFSASANTLGGDASEYRPPKVQVPQKKISDFASEYPDAGTSTTADAALVDAGPRAP